MQDFASKIQSLESEITELKTNTRRNGNYLRTKSKTATFYTQVNTQTHEVVYFTRATITPANDNPILFSVAVKKGQTLPQIVAVYEDSGVSTGYGFFVLNRDLYTSQANYQIDMVITATDDFTITTERVYY